MMRPKHHHPANGMDPVVGQADTAEQFPGHADPGLSNKTMNGKTDGQPDKRPQRPDVAVAKSKTVGGGDLRLGFSPD